ncbi:MAG: cupin domain-containing protein [Rhodobacteraceae bacterium]|nr:cupin domain-containing protein [Paracoccaceae bacterium]
MPQVDMESRIVRYGELIPCRTAFIDTHTPGSDRKENFTILGSGVSENPDQHVHIDEKPGFNVGAAGQPPKCRNSLHSHRTAEVFYVLKGRWRFFWGRWGTAGEVVLEEGDIFDIPTGIFRGFENIGNEYGMLKALLGGDDAGGGVIWAPQVIEDARQHGLILAETGRLYDSKKGQSLPPGTGPMPPLSEDELAGFPELPVDQVVPRFVARRWDMMALAAHGPAPVIGEHAMITDRPGFEVDFISATSIPADPYESSRHEILMVREGHWKFAWNGGATILAPGDTCAVPPGTERSLRPAMSGRAGMFRVRSTDDPAGPTWGMAQ